MLVWSILINYMNHSSILKRSLFLLSFVFLFFAFQASHASAATCTFASTESTNDFNLNANWSCGTAPTVADLVVVPAGTSTTMTASSTVGDLNATGTINTATFNLTVAGTATIPSGGVVTSTSGTLTFTGAVSSTGSIGSVSGNMLFSSTLSLNGTLNVGSGTATTTGAATFATGIATVNNNSGTFVLMASGTGNPIYNRGTGTFRVAGSTDLQAFSGVLYNDFVSIKTAGTVDFGSSSNTILGTLTMNGGSLDSAAGNFTVVGASTILAGATVTSTSGTLTFTGAVSSTGSIGSSSGNMLFTGTYVNNGTFDVGSGTATTTQTFINNGTTYGGSGIFSPESDIYNNGTFAPQTGTVRFISTLNATQSINGTSGFSFGTLTIGNSSVITTLAANVSSTSFTLSSGALDVNGYRFAATSSFSNTGGYINVNSGTLVGALTTSDFTNASGTVVTSLTNPGSMYVTITDPSRNLSATSTESFSVTVTGNLASGGDSETLTLVETSAASGVFRNAGAMNVKYAGVATAGGGEFEINGTGSGSYTYTDAYDTSDTTSTSVTLNFAGASAGVSASSGSSSGGGGVGSAQALAPIVTTYQTLVTNLANLGIPVHALVKLPDDGNLSTQEDSAVYYIGTDGKRHAFPNSKVYFTWYADFSQVQIVNLTQLSSIPLGSNITYKPGVRMVKFTTDPKVYAVDKGGVLRWIASEDLATAFYGSAWNTMIDDVSDAFYVNYTFGAHIISTADFSVSGVSTVVYPD